MTQQARNLTWPLQERGSFAFLIRDRDSKYPGSFDAVFAAEGIRTILTPYQSPRANAFAERWVRTVRHECLDWVLVLGRRHLDRVLREYVMHYNRGRPHRGLHLAAPEGSSTPVNLPPDLSRVRRRDLLGGLVHEYEMAA